nr:hypothetical protein [Tanacetum cinerariifolium]
MIKDEAGNEVEVPPVTAQQILARTREKKAKSTLLMAIPDEHLARFHRIKDAKTLWAAIKIKFGGNAESKKMQKNKAPAALMNLMLLIVFLLLQAIVLNHKEVKLKIFETEFLKKASLLDDLDLNIIQAQHMKNTFITDNYFQEKMKEMSDTLNNLVPELTLAKTNELIKEAVLRMFNDAVKQDRESSTSIMDSIGKDAKPLKSCLMALKIQNIKGKLLEKDGKPLQVKDVGNNVLEPFGLTKNPTYGMDDVGAGNDDTSRKNDVVTGMQNERENSHVQPMKNVSVLSSPKQSFDYVVSHEKNYKVVNFRALFNPEKVDNSDFVLPLETIQAVKHKFENSLVGYFVGKSVVFPLVKSYVLEQGPWLIRNTPIILKKWTPNISLSKDKVTKVPVWVKMHRVLVVAYFEDGLSLIGSHIRKPIMLDAFTSSMCIDTWGRIGFARALIEDSVEADLKQEVTIAMPYEDGSGVVAAHITVEATQAAPNDGFTTVTNKKRNKGKNQNVPNNTANESEELSKKNTNEENNNEVKLKNLFEKLNEITSVVDPGGDLPSERRLLWVDLGLHKNFVRGCPWILMGDFNVALNLEDSYSGSSSLNFAMYEFKDCVSKIEVMDVNSIGLHYTWNQKPKGGGGKLKKLDRIMGNLDFHDTFPGAYDIFQPYWISDHSHAMLKIMNLAMNKPKPFKFFNFITLRVNFCDVVASQ